ncbi:MAG: menaquinone biosynthesis protein [Desulfovibrio sp.]|nr:menaquinone biosynthesis protein [Desulfovibrio sp.]
MLPLALGRIAFINVLPVYYALEHGIVPHPYQLVYGNPAELNDKMKNGELAISSCSCMEYARRWRNYYLASDLCIASHGPVMSVLLLSREPLECAEGHEILISGQSHTSVVLTKLLLKERYHVQHATFRTGQVREALDGGEQPWGVLTIGDEALNLRAHPLFAVKTDLACAWKEWTGLPFVFGVWIISRRCTEEGRFDTDPALCLRQSRAWGLSHLDLCLPAVRQKTPLSPEELLFYYSHALCFSLGAGEQQGLRLFYEKSAQAGLLEEVPPLAFFPATS